MYQNKSVYFEEINHWKFGNERKFIQQQKIIYLGQFIDTCCSTKNTFSKLQADNVSARTRRNFVQIGMTGDWFKRFRGFKRFHTKG